MSDHVVNMISDANRVTLDHLHDHAIKSNLSNAVASGPIGSVTIENERACPDYLAQFSEGWWFAHYAGRAEQFVVRLVPYCGELRVLFAGEAGLTLMGEVAAGLRIDRKVEFPTWVS